MHTTQIASFDYGVWDGSIYTPNKWTFSYRSNVKLAVRTRDYPDTVKRLKPADGFLMSTSRTTSSLLYNQAVMDYCTSAYGTKYTNYPLWYMYPRGTMRMSSQTGGSQLSDPTTTLNRASMYNQVRSNLKSEETNLANMLGEYRETADTFIQLTEAVLTQGKSLLKRHGKPGKRRGKVDVASTVSSNHLGFTYGIRPLAQDMGTACAELVNGIKQKPLMREGVVTRRDRVSNVGWRLSNSTSYTRRALSEVTVVTTFRTQWRVYFNQNTLLVSLADHGMLNPASLAWELTPYSFVLDWWFNVGDVLSSLDNLLTMDKLYALDSSSVKTYEYCRPPLDSVTFVAQQGFFAGRTDVRGVAQEIPRVATLSYKPSLSLGHFLNGLALLHVAAGRL